MKGSGELKNTTRNTLDAWFNFKFKLLVYGAAVGLFAGIVVVLYRFALERGLEASLLFYAYARLHLWLLLPALIVLGLLGWATGILVTRQPSISGSGIPQVKGVVQGRAEMNGWKAVLAKFVGGTLSIGAGLSLGREGPSIQIGACVGQGISRLLKRLKTEENILITCGASAGLAAAFNAPIAGVIFALEEIHMNFSPIVMITALMSALIADFVSKQFFGLHTVFNFGEIPAIPLSQYGHLIVLGIVVGLGGILFNKAIYFVQDSYRKIPGLKPQFRPVIPFVMAGLIGPFLPQVLGGGNGLVDSLPVVPLPLTILLGLLAAKFLFTLLSYGSSAPGGIFLPMLVLGGFIGTAYCSVAGSLTGTPLDVRGFLVLAMAGYLTASVKAPITGILLITEMTGSFSNLLPTGIVCLTAFLVAEMLRSEPVYEKLLARYLSGSEPVHSDSRQKLLIETPVHQGCRLDGSTIGELVWPEGCLIVSVKRGSEELLPRGSLQLSAGDQLLILTDAEAAPSVREALFEASVVRIGL